MIDQRLEHFLLYTLADDWIPFGEFLEFARRITPKDSTRERVGKIIRDLAERELIVLGGWGDSGTWEAWTTSVDEGMRRIAVGTGRDVGYIHATEKELGATEVFRADLSSAGQALLESLGNPFELYGDPWGSTREPPIEKDLPAWRE